MSMRLELEPSHVDLPADGPVVTVLTITNTSQVIAGYGLRVLGADPAWVELSDPEPRLFPGETARVVVSLRLPPMLPAGERRMGVQVRELVGEVATTVLELVVRVPGVPDLDVRLDPTTVTAGRRGSFAVMLDNRGNLPAVGRLVGTDPEAKLEFRFEPPQFRLDPGRTQITELRARAKRPWFGTQVVRPFELRASDEPPGTAARTDTPPAAVGVLVQRPVFSRSVLSLLGLLLVVTLFAVVITTALNSVVQRSAADRDLALQVAQARDERATTGTSSLAGAVRLISTGEPLGGVSVEAFDAADTEVPLATVATADDGSFLVGALPEGTYKLRVRGAGFPELWYPAAATDADAVELELRRGQAATGLTVLLGGVPATVSGTVSGEDVGGATATLELPLDSPAIAELVSNPVGTAPDAPATPAPDDGAGRDPGAIVRTAVVGSDGGFSLDQVPSPAVYDLVISKPGHATQVHRVDVAAGEDRAGIEIQMLEGDGTIAGTVNGADGPLGGASITASSGEVTVRTVSVTQGAVGSFALRGLPTPATYTVVVTAPDHAPTTLRLDLGPGQQLDGVVVGLGMASGTLGGKVTVAGAEAGGVLVTVSDGATTRQVVTTSGASAGSWQVSGLRIPSAYTITFSRSDLQTQVVSVSLDGFGRVTSGAGGPDRVDVAMRVATARLTGTVTQATSAGGTAPAGNVQVTASSGTTDFVVRTASTPPGAIGSYAIDNLPPGTYTVTFARSGTRSVSTIVTLSAGQQRTLDTELAAPAAVHGTVTRTVNGTPTGVANAWVGLYPAGTYGTAAPPAVTTTTDPAGRYRFEDVDAPAHYVVEVRLSETGAPLAASEPATVRPSDDATLDVVIP